MVLLDRGFCNNEIIEFLEFRGLNYVMAAVRHFDIKEAANNIEAAVKEMASQSGVDIEDDYKLGKWAR